MSATLYALVVVLQGTCLSFSPGYTSASECMHQYKGPYVSCFAYYPDSTTWTAFFKLPTGEFRTVGRVNTTASVSDTSARLRMMSRPLAGSWLCPPPVALPAGCRQVIIAPASSAPRHAREDYQARRAIGTAQQRYPGERPALYTTWDLFWAPTPSEDTFASFLSQPEQRNERSPSWRRLVGSNTRPTRLT